MRWIKIISIILPAYITPFASLFVFLVSLTWTFLSVILSLCGEAGPCTWHNTECSMSAPWGVASQRRRYLRFGGITTMELVSKPNATVSVWEHFILKANDRGEPLDLDKLVCRSCGKTVPTKSASTTNIHLHFKYNHPMQFPSWENYYNQS